MNQRVAIVHKAGSKIPPVYKLHFNFSKDDIKGLVLW